MATRSNRFFNDPAFAQAGANLAAAFAPLSGSDEFGYARAAGQDYQNRALAQAWEAMTAAGVTPQTQDQFGIAATLFGQGFAPTQSNRAVDIASADRRYATDTSSATDLAIAALNAETALRGNVLGAMTDPSGRQAMSTEELLALTGIDMPGFGVATPVAPTQAQLQGQTYAGLAPEIQEAITFGSTPIEPIVTPDGPRNVTRLDAIGQEPFVNQGSQAAPEPITYTNAAGARVGGFVVNGRFVDANGAPLSPEEAGTATRVGQPQGSNEELGVTNSNQTDFNRVQQTVTTSNMLIDDIDALIRSQPGAAGLPGTLQMLAQDFIQVGRELGAAFADNPDAIVTPEMLAQIAGTGEQYDPTFREIRSGMLQLAYLNAQRDNPRGEVSRFALERQIEALGQGAFANDQSILAALGMSRRANERALAGAEALVGRAPAAGGPGAAPAGAAAPPTAVNPETGETLVFINGQWVPAQ